MDNSYPTMEKFSVLKQMAEYDFNSPIDVTMIFEDSDDDITDENYLKEQCENIHDSRNKNPPNDRCLSNNLKVNKTHKHSSHNADVNKSKHTECHRTDQTTKTFGKTSEEIMIVDCDHLCNIDKILESNKIKNNSDRLEYQKETISNQDLSIISNENQNVTEINEEAGHVVHNQINDQEPITTFIEDMLKKLSEHLLLIMQSYYHYRQKNTALDLEELRKRQRVYSFIKSHFFELSYTTMVSIFLPHEQNVNFIKQFLDNTALMANKRSWKWNFTRRHVEPFFNELVIWSKQRQAYIKSINQQQPSGKNCILKRYLGRPPQPLHPQHLKTIPNNDNVPTSTAQNNVCIFSSGAPGSEIVINITSDTLKSYTERQNKSIVEYPGHNHIFPSSGQSAPRLTPPPPYKSSRNEHQMNNNANYVQQRQSVASLSRRNTKHTKNKNNPTSQPVHAIQNNQNFGTPNYPSQYTIPTVTHPCDGGFMNTGYDNRNYNNQMHGRQIENQISSGPIITNITSLNAKTNMTLSRCIMCGKYTEANYPSHCSYLCQELDSQFQKSTQAVL